MTRILLIVMSAVLLAACQSSESSEDRVRFDPVEPFATGSTTTTTTTVAARTEAPQWTSRSTDTCVELSIGATVATTCAVLPGVSSWTVAGAHFAVARGDIALKNGVVIRADALGFAVGFLPSDTVPTSDVANVCGRHDLAPGVAEHYPDSTVAWQPARCEEGVASVTAVLEDRSEVIALMEKTNDGQWQVFATFRAPVRCKLLDPSSRNKCKVLRYDD